MHHGVPEIKMKQVEPNNLNTNDVYYQVEPNN